MSDIHSILENKKNIGDYFRLTWYFEKPLEKILLVALCLLGTYTIFRWIFNWLGS